MFMLETEDLGELFMMLFEELQSSQGLRNMYSALILHFRKEQTECAANTYFAIGATLGSGGEFAGCQVVLLAGGDRIRFAGFKNCVSSV
jgi:hypothetical protein